MLRAIQVCIVLLIVVTRRLQFCCYRMVLTLVSGTQEVNILLPLQFLSCQNVFVSRTCLKQRSSCYTCAEVFSKWSFYTTVISHVGASHIYAIGQQKCSVQKTGSVFLPSSELQGQYIPCVQPRTQHLILFYHIVFICKILFTLRC